MPGVGSIERGLMTRYERIEQAEKITQELWPAISAALGGKAPEAQGAVLADLTAIWIVGHLVLGDAIESPKLREQMLALQVSTTRELIERIGSLPHQKPEHDGRDNLDDRRPGDDSRKP